jgi:hypothetical protein
MLHMDTYNRHRLTDAERAAIEAKIKAHYGNLGQIAVEHGVSRAYVRVLAQKLGVEYYTQAARSKRSPLVALKKRRAEKTATRKARLAELEERWKIGETCSAIAAAMGYSTQVHVASLIARMRNTCGEDRFPYRRTHGGQPVMPVCPACKVNSRVSVSPPESASRGKFFCPCNETGSPGDSGHFNA